MSEYKKIFSKASHDLRSPLSVLMGFLEYKGNVPDDGSEESQYLQALQSSVVKISRIADELAVAGGEMILAKKNADETVDEIRGVISRKKMAEKLIGKTVLIVDDDAGIRTQWRLFFGKRGYHVVEALSGESLLATLVDFSKIELAIVDYHYENSDLNGLDVLEYLHRKKIPTIHLCTANHADPKVSRKAIELGATSVIPKPLRPDLLQGLFG